jgi:hypothetical protein
MNCLELWTCSCVQALYILWASDSICYGGPGPSSETLWLFETPCSHRSFTSRLICEGQAHTMVSQPIRTSSLEPLVGENLAVTGNVKCARTGARHMALKILVTTLLSSQQCYELDDGISGASGGLKM